MNIFARAVLYSCRTVLQRTTSWRLDQYRKAGCVWRLNRARSRCCWYSRRSWNRHDRDGICTFFAWRRTIRPGRRRTGNGISNSGGRRSSFPSLYNVTINIIWMSAAVNLPRRWINESTQGARSNISISSRSISTLFNYAYSLGMTACIDLANTAFTFCGVPVFPFQFAGDQL